MAIVTALSVILSLVVSVCGGRYANAESKQNATDRAQLRLLVDSLDLYADPCNDFHQYACGNWESTQRHDGHYQEIISKVDYYTNMDMVRVLERPKRFKAFQELEFMQKTFNFYKSCVNIRRLRTHEYLKYLAMHEQLHWPDHQGRNYWRVDWLKTLAIMRQYGMNGVFVEEITMPRRDNASATIIDLDKPSKTDNLKSLSFKGLSNIMQALHLKVRYANLRKFWFLIRQFESRLEDLAEIADTGGVHVLKVRDLPLNWLKRYLSLVLNETNLDGDMEVYVQNIPYLKAVPKLIAEYNLEFILQYLHLRFVLYMSLNGPRAFSPMDCSAYTRTAMPLAMHWLYQQTHPKLQPAIPKVKQIFHELIQHFKTRMSNNMNQFNAEELNYLLKKLSTIRLKIGNLPERHAQQKLQLFYKDLGISERNNFYSNHMKVLKFNNKVLHDRLKLKTTNSAEEFIHYGETEFAANASPYFLQTRNIVILPQALLLPPVYDSDLDDVFQYSLLGFLLAHEITHSFDNMGLDVDHTGQLSIGQFTHRISSKRFKEKIACLRDLNPSAVDEKIADVNGLRLAYEVYFHNRPGQLAETFTFSGYTFTKPQIFFLNVAQFFCSTRNVTMVDISEHGADRERISDAIRHFPQFAKAFQCPENSTMRTKTNCQIWR